MAKGQKSQVVTKKHLARQERERLQTRYILIGSIAIIIIVVALVGYGIISQFIIQPQQPVAKVANNAITTKQFQTYARYERLQLINQYQQYQQFAQYFGNDPSSTSYLQQYLAEINYRLEPENLGQSALDYLVADRLIQSEAEKRGITVAKEQVNKKLDEYFGYFRKALRPPNRPPILYRHQHSTRPRLRWYHQLQHLYQHQPARLHQSSLSLRKSPHRPQRLS
jgi:hypothetical protein